MLLCVGARITECDTFTVHVIATNLATGYSSTDM